MPAAKVLEPEPAHGPRRTPERVRTRRPGLERNGPGRAGPERIGRERAKAGGTGRERAGPKRAGPERDKPERTRPERPGPDLTGPGRDQARRACGADSQLRVPAVRKGRARSCPLDPDRDRDWDRDLDLGQGCTASTGRRARSTGRGTGAGPEPAQRDPRRAARTSEISHRAFTVIRPDPVRRREIQRKAEAELAALEDLRLSRTTAFVCFPPSSVGGCLSLQEVRLKQQEEMLKARRRSKKPPSIVVGETPETNK
ncbi:unnamed protein product [Ophioblennius macclurei]